MSYKWTDKEASSRPPFSEMEKIEPTSKKIDLLLHKLLIASSPYGSEAPVAKIILDHVKKCGYDVTNSDLAWFSEKEKNLIIDLRNEAGHTTMFSAHMDTMQDNALPIELWMTTNKCKSPGDGFIYAAKSKTLYTIFDYENPQEEINLHTVLQAARVYNYTMYLDKTKKNGDKVLASIFEQPYNAPEKDTGLKFWAKKSHTVRVPATLGADDKIGCYIMCKLIAAGVPGLYVFHVGEERGCKGSKYFSEAYKDFLQGLEGEFSAIERCIAFDRAGYKDVIARQRGQHTCSTEFTKDLAKALNANMPEPSWFNPDVTGVYTDSAEYKEIVPECTNLSVGYFQQHGPGEHTDYIWLDSIFIPAVLKVEWDKLTTYRDPKKIIQPTTHHQNHYTQSYGTGTVRSTIMVKPENVTWSTSLVVCPKWDPEDGILEGVPEYGMKRIIESFLAIDAKTDYLRTTTIYNMAKRTDLLKEELINVYTYLSMKGITKKDVERDIGPLINGVKKELGQGKEYLDGNPMELFDQDDQTAVEQMLGEQFCTSCQYVLSQCSCNETSDTKSPQRCDYENEAMFQTAIAEYTIRAYPQDNKKPLTVTELLSDDDIKARLEK